MDVQKDLTELRTGGQLTGGASTRKFSGKEAGAALLTLAAALALWLFIAASYHREAIRDISQSLETINSYKCSEIASWLDDHDREAVRLSRHPFLAGIVSEEISKPGTRRAELISWLKDHTAQKRYSNMAFLTVKGAVIAATPGYVAGTEKPFKEAFERAAQKGGPQLTDIYRTADDRLRMAMFSPLSSGGRGGKPVCVLVIKIDPEIRFYNLLRAAPLFITAAETLLVRKEGEYVLYLNELDNLPGSALKLTRRLSEEFLPAAAALRGGTGFFAGVDYRGVKVFSAIAPVPGSNWAIITKVDRDAIIAPVKRMEYLQLALILLAAGFLYILGYTILRARERAGQAIIREGERRLAALFSNLPGVAYRSVNPRNWTIEFLSEGSLGLTGYRPEELLTGSPPSFFELIVPEDRERVRQILQTLPTGNNRYELTYSLKCKDGAIKTVWEQGLGVKGASGAFETLEGFISDITPLKRAEAALKVSEQIFSEFMEHSPIYVFFKDENLRAIHLSRNYEAMIGKPLSQLLGKSMDELFPSDLAKSMVADDKRILAEGKEIVVEEELNGRSYRTIKFPIKTEGKPPYLAGYTIDITEQKKAEEALRASETAVRAKLQALLSPEGDIETLEMADIFDVPSLQGIMDEFYKLTNIGIGILDIKGKVLVGTGWQDICTKFHRVHPETARNCLESDTILSEGIEPGTCKSYLCKNNLRDIATPIMVGGKHLGNLFLGQFLYEDEERNYALFREQARRYGFNEEEYIAAYDRMPRFGREQVDVVMRFYRQFAELVSNLSYGKVKLARALAQSDLARAALRESETRYKALFSEAVEGILVADLETKKFSYCNPAICRMLGYTQEELTKLGVPDIHPKDALNTVLAELETQAQGKKKTTEVPCLRKDGTVFYASISTSKISIDGRECALGFFTDITERKHAEKTRLAQLHFLESMSQVNLAIQRANNLEKMMSDVLNAVLTTFDCDRAWLFYPCDPDAPSFRVPMEITKPEYPGAKALNIDITMPPDMARDLREALESAGPVTYSVGTEKTINKMTAEQFGVKSQMLVALHPKSGKPWVFGIHQCSYPRVWTPEEIRLFQEIGWRLADSLTGLLTYKDLQESDNSLKKAQQLARIGNWTLDLASGKLTWSDEIYRIFEIDREKFGASYEAFLDAIHPDDRDYVNKAYSDSLKNRSAYDIVHRLLMKDGRIKYVDEFCETSYAPDGRPLVSIGTVQDITERRLAELALDKLNRDLIEKKQEMENFLYITTHDLRSPLVNIQGFSQNLQRYVSELREALPLASLEPETRNKLEKLTGESIPAALKFVLNGSRNMDALVSALLKVSRLGRVVMKPETLEMNGLMATIAASLSFQLNEAGGAIETGPLPPCRADRAAVTQLFTNLLDNAIKYRAVGRPLAVTVTGEVKGGMALYTVADNGSGIPEKDLQKIWDIFYKSDKAHGKHGEGIGLAMAKRLIERNGGRIRAESKEGTGSVFRLELPAAEEKDGT